MGLSRCSQIHIKLIQGSCLRSLGLSQAFPLSTAISQQLQTVLGTQRLETQRGWLERQDLALALLSPENLQASSQGSLMAS